MAQLSFDRAGEINVKHWSKNLVSEVLGNSLDKAFFKAVMGFVEDDYVRTYNSLERRSGPNGGAPGCNPDG